MDPGADGIAAGSVKNQGARVTIYLEETTYSPSTVPDDPIETNPVSPTDPSGVPDPTPGEDPAVTPDGNPSVTPESESPAQPDPTSSGSTDEENSAPGQNTPDPALKSKTALWIVIGVVAIAAAGTVAFFALKKKK